MIKIVADTLSCISVEEAQSLDLPLLPQMIIFGEEIFRDDTEIDTITFLEKLKKSKELPKTAAPSPALYQPVFQEIIESGHTPLVICPTAELSGTYRSAIVAAKDFKDVEIKVVDTKALGGGLGAIVKQAVGWAANGLDATQIEIKAMEMASRLKTYFMVATLEYLYKGGRLGGAQAILGSVLQVKPILQLKNGVVEPAGSQRTRKKAITYIHEIIREECPHSDDAFLTVMHGATPDEAADMAATLRSITGIQDIPIYDLPAAILVHGGPGAFGVSFFVES